MIETEEKQAAYILVGVETPKSDLPAEESLAELESLLETAGGRAAGRMVQKMDAFDPRTYIGSGKVEELKRMLEETGADGILCDDELTPAQIRNLDKRLDTEIIDRTLVILDIFSKRAVTREGKMQIELAQQTYRLNRLSGMGVQLSRQGGSGVGVHSRGEGESKLELDRRRIRARIAYLKEQLKKVSSDRTRERESRKKSDLPVVALIGYTNAGKSTLFNRLTSAGVLEEDKLFATLDTTVRRCSVTDGRSILLVDTVGFIHKLPADLVDAFRSTLEEVKEADILLHVVDASSSKASLEMKVTYEEMEQLEAADRPFITFLNKQDLVTENAEPMPRIPYHAEAVVKGSAFCGEDRQKVLESIRCVLEKEDQDITVKLPYDQTALVEKVRREGVIKKESYEEDGIVLTASVPARLRTRLAAYETEKEKEDAHRS